LTAYGGATKVVQTAVQQIRFT